MKSIVYIDTEIGAQGKILDIGAIKWNGEKFHSAQIKDFVSFIDDCSYICGHNIISHDLKYLKPFIQKTFIPIDTLYLSPLLFPEKPYHRLLKDDKLIEDSRNNPLNDSIKAERLFEDEIKAFTLLDDKQKRVFYDLLKDNAYFNGFFDYIGYAPGRWSSLFRSKSDSIREILSGKICRNAGIDAMIKNTPTELAYAVAIAGTNDIQSVTPAWVNMSFPKTEYLIRQLRGKPCNDPNCDYCRNTFNSKAQLKRWFGYDDFRTFDGEALQQQAVEAALNGESLLAVFPTGGGKSLTFQLPALVDSLTTKSLTVIISPLQSLMKDQVENLEKKGITEAVFINGMLSPIERADALKRIQNGEASLLYIAPEQLRSKTIERLLLSRNVARFVIDEAHCFSAWGQDFRIEYMHIAEFISNLQAQKGLTGHIPVSCFTATAKPKVISDICDYFFKNNGIILEKFTSGSVRTNLRYTVLNIATKVEKYTTLRSLISSKGCPTIVYLSRTKAAEEIAARLVKDGINAAAFHGKMDKLTKIRNQEDFIKDKIQVMVATSAFGMGVDKSNVGLVVHYDISDSLENYIQESGRAGRDLNTNADCYVLYNDDDLNKHFVLLNQTKLTLSEINQVWRAIKNVTQKRKTTRISALEIARKAGWEDTNDVETKVKSAIAALDNAGFVKRGMNCPRVFATSIAAQNFEAASNKIDSSGLFSEQEKVNAKRIIKSLISEKKRACAGTAEAESRIDYLSDILGIETYNVIKSVEMMRSAGILAKDADMTAFLDKKPMQRLSLHAKMEARLIELLNDCNQTFDLKQINSDAIENGLNKSGLKTIRTILYFWTITNCINKDQRTGSDNKVRIRQICTKEELLKRFHLRIDLCKHIIRELADLENLTPDKEYFTANFSLVQMLNSFNARPDISGVQATIDDIQEAVLYLSKTETMSIEGSFMVTYNKLEIERLADNKLRYKKEYYHDLDNFYKQRIQQIHIVGEFANMIVGDYDKAMEYVSDYFHMEFKTFIKKYFDAEKEKSISLNISQRKHEEIFGRLTPTQKRIIEDKESKYIVVPAGPGSGKTFVLVRKLASLVLMEDIKSEKLLMLTFSRAAASEFYQRLEGLIGGAAKFVEIKTFHSYAFDISGEKGTLEKSDEIIKSTVERIRNGEIETSRITKSVLVIDEAQDMSRDEFALVEELIDKNEDIRVIAVGDDDQNIYAFRGSDSAHMKKLIDSYGATVYNMLENFRSATSIVGCADSFACGMSQRLKSAHLIPVRKETGQVKFTVHPGTFEEAVVRESLRDNLPGSTCLLTFTNDDAMVLSSMFPLPQNGGRKACLVQSNDGFSLTNLAELHFFLNIIRSAKCPEISEVLWSKAKESISQKYAGSRCIGTVLRCIGEFESSHEIKYVSDLENFIFESSLDDFESYESDSGQNAITVSTIHKSKGREYDNVYISLKGVEKLTEETKRMLYVAFTRAKNNLSVHLSEKLAADLRIRNASFVRDDSQYDSPRELIRLLSHKEVVLSFFKGCRELVESLRSGDVLSVSGDYLYAETGGRYSRVAKFSEKFRKEILALSEKGYEPSGASVRFIVFWHHENEDGSGWEETPVILPEIRFRLKS